MESRNHLIKATKVEDDDEREHSTEDNLNGCGSKNHVLLHTDKEARY